jgi:outer membrane protein assembly factor BamB
VPNLRWLLVVVPLVVLSARAQPAAGQAVAFQADAGHTGRVTAGAPRPPLVWRWTVPLEERMSYPVAADGRVFVATGAFYRPAEIVAIDARRGRILWRVTLPGPAYVATLALDDGRLFVSSDGDPNLLALAPEDGRVLWSARAPGFGAPVPVASSGLVVVPGEAVTAFSQADGHVVWRMNEFAQDPRVAAAGDSVWIGSSCSGAIRLRLADGIPLWRDVQPCDGNDSRIPVATADRMYPRGGLQHVRDASAGTVLGGGWPTSYGPAIADGIGLFTDASRPVQPVHFGHTLTARDLPAGRVRWRFRGDGYLDSAPLIAGRVAYVGSGSGRLYGLALRTGRVRWRADAGAPVLASDEDLSGEFLSGLAATDDLLLVPAYKRLVAFGPR